MKEIREYEIPFVGLKLGVHHFNYELTEKFFDLFEGSQIERGRIFVDLSFDKKDRLFVLNFDISGTVETECDRCEQDFNLLIHGNYTIYVKLGDMREEDEDSEEVIWVADSESHIDVSEIMYEFIHLSLPIQKVHPDHPDGSPGCDPEILKQLGYNADEEIKKDPRWDILNNLNKN